MRRLEHAEGEVAGVEDESKFVLHLLARFAEDGRVVRLISV
jgi:hypothetical protein